MVAALALGAGTIAEVAAASGLEPPEVVKALRRLERGGLVSREKDQVRLHAELFKESARAAAPTGPVEPLSDDPETDAVLRAFTRDGRIVSVPVARRKRRLLLEHVAGIFEPGVRYPELEVNAMMRAWYADYAALRRHLIDAALLDRADGFYWRIGGPVRLDDPATDPPATEGGDPDPAGVPDGTWSGLPTAGADPERPVRQVQRVAAYGLIRDGDRVLLTHLSRGDARGRWTLPGGGLDFGERPADAVVREVYEETGLTVRVEELLDGDAETVDSVDRDGRPVVGHPVRFLYRLAVLGGTLGVVEEEGSTDDVRWFGPDELPELTPVAGRVLRTGRLNG